MEEARQNEVGEYETAYNKCYISHVDPTDVYTNRHIRINQTLYKFIRKQLFPTTITECNSLPPTIVSGKSPNSFQNNLIQNVCN